MKDVNLKVQHLCHDAFGALARRAPAILFLKHVWRLLLAI